MLTFELQDRIAIPVRAIPLITGGCFDAHNIIDLFYDPERWADGPQPRPLPLAFRVDERGTICSLPAARWSLDMERAKHQPSSAPDSPEQIRLLPPGTFVWVDQFRPFYQAIAVDADATRPSPAGAYPWYEDVTLNEEQRSLVWEGFSGLGHLPAAPRRKQRNSRSQHLAGLRTEIDEILGEAAERGFVAQKNRMPGKKADLIQILTKRNPPRAGRAEATYSDDFSELGLRWTGGKNRRDRVAFLACFDLQPQLT